jgi:hypothetical protein
VIVLDHTPLGLDEAADAGESSSSRGHTHNGQLFPFNLITRRIYEQSWGVLRKKKTIFYVSCGVGTWGPPSARAAFRKSCSARSPFPTRKPSQRREPLTQRCVGEILRPLSPSRDGENRPRNARSLRPGGQVLRGDSDPSHGHSACENDTPWEARPERAHRLQG